MAAGAVARRAVGLHGKAERKMNLPGVLVLSPDAADYLPLLDSLAERGTALCAAASAKEAVALCAGQPVVLGRPDLVADALPALAGLRWVQSTWAGVEPLLRLDRRDYLLTNIRDVFGPQMAEYVFGHLLALRLRLAERRAAQLRREWWPARSGTLTGQTLGILGTGSIGRHLARVGQALGMRVVGCSRNGAPAGGFEAVYPVSRLDAFLQGLDALVSVLPGTPATDRLLDEAALRRLPGHCILVNVGRGSVLDEAALARALRRGELAGAVLDVFRDEPLPAESPLWDAPGAVITAHVAAESRPADIARLFVGNYHRYCAGDKLVGVVDFERGY
jgi:phosphoglycerate dehydrogenase-like enzyme